MGKRYNKTDLINRIVRRTGYTKESVADVINCLLDEMQKILSKEGNSVMFKNFGALIAVKAKPRKGINPRTKEPIEIPSRLRIKFKKSKNW